MSDINTKTDYPVIGQLALKHSLIKEEELKKALAHCADNKNIDEALEKYFVSKKLFSDRDMKRLSTAAKAMVLRQKDIRFGVIAINLGLINKSLVEMALDEQKKEITLKKKARPIGTILVEAGIISSAERDMILKEQQRLQEKDRLQKEKEKKEKNTNEILADEKQKADHLSQQRKSNIVEHKNKSSTQIRKRAEEIEKESTSSRPKENDIDLNFARTKIFPLGLKLVIPEDGLAAYFLKTKNFNKNTTVKDILDILEDENITFGIVDYTLIKGFIKSKIFSKKPFRVAMGQKPDPGKDSKIQYFFDTNRLKPGEIDKDGKIDFKDRGKIPYVKKGTILAKKIPAVKGKDGKNIFGDIIPAKPPADTKLKYDKGAFFADNNTKIIASIDGQPKLSWAGVVSVLDEFVTRQDVDYETGHVSYQGNIRIRGCVQNGFKVKGDNISANEIDGGIIHADGNITVNGIISKARIYSRGNIRAKFIHKSTILSMGNIDITKEIVDSTIENSGACIIKRGKILNSRITSKMGVYVKDIGTEMSMPSIITTGIDIFILKETEKLENKIYDQQMNLNLSEKKKERLEENNKKNQDRITMLAQVQDKARLEIENIMSKISSLDVKNELQKANELKERLNKLKKNAKEAELQLNRYFEKTDIQDKKIARLNISIALQRDKLKEFLTEKENLIAWGKETPGIAMIKSTGEIMAGTVVAGKHAKKIIKHNVKNVTIKEVVASGEQDNEHLKKKKQAEEKKEKPLSWEIQVIPG